MTTSAQPRSRESAGEEQSPPPARGPLAALAHVLARRRRPVFLLLAALSVVATLWGANAGEHLRSGGYVPESSESARADRILAQRFDAGAPNMVLLAKAQSPVGAPGVTEAGLALTRDIASRPNVVFAESFWTTGDPSLRAEDERAALILVKLAGDEDTATRTAQQLAPQVTGEQGPLQVAATGQAPVNDQLEQQSAEDLTRAELLAAPLTMIILLLAFGSLVAASLPMLVGVVSVIGTLAVLRLLATFTDVSLFAINITTALGFGLAVDYSLFIVTRYREELARGREVRDAIAESLRTAGRTVAFSALTVAVSLSALLVFPVYFLRSLAYAGIAVVVLAALSSVVVLPAALAFTGRRIDRLDVFAPFRRRFTARRSGKPSTWHRLATGVTRRPVLAGSAVAVLLILLAAPFGHARFGLTDHRILPSSSSAHAAAESIRENFAGASTSPVTVVMPDLGIDNSRGQLRRYVREVSLLPGSGRVDSAVGTWRSGQQVSPPDETSAVYSDETGTWLSMTSDGHPNSAAGEEHVRAVRSVEPPSQAFVGGEAATLVDTKSALTDRLPWAAAVIVVSTFLLLFLFSGSVVLPLKALLVNLLSLTASFGAMVYVFQDGHLKWLVGDFVHTGQLEVTVPILMFCVAFGLSMDYTVFLFSRIREEYLATSDNTHAVIFGVDHTGRLITAAALVVTSVLAALATSQLSLLKLLGAGLALAVLVDATLVRGVLVPATMKLLGHLNWWSPPALRRLHEKIGLRDT